MSLGIVIVLISILGYISNLLNWRYLNYNIVFLLYYIGALVHETSHAAVCIATGAKIEEFKVFSSQPHVTHRKSKLPLVGELFISSAPIAGGLLFLFLLNRYLLGNYFVAPILSGWRDIFIEPLKLLLQINLFQWQSWIMILLFFNVGAMLGPSIRDLKNIWPLLIILFFIKSAFFADLGLMALSLILTNIVIQLVIVLVLKITSPIIRP